MKRLSLPTHGRYFATTMYLIIVKVVSTAPGYGLRIMAYLHVVSSLIVTALNNPTLVWYQLVGR